MDRAGLLAGSGSHLPPRQTCLLQFGRSLGRRAPARMGNGCDALTVAYSCGTGPTFATRCKKEAPHCHAAPPRPGRKTALRPKFSVAFQKIIRREIGRASCRERV